MKLSIADSLAQIFPCGPDTDDGEDQVGTCDISGECDEGESVCTGGNDDCPLRVSVCCVEGTPPAGC